jgi:hypothetical protein
MKRHEACYWLNKMAEDVRRSIRYRQEDCEKVCEGASEQEVERRRQYAAERIAEHEKELAALEIAGDALAPNKCWWTT